MIKEIKYETCIEPGPFIGVPVYHVVVNNSDTDTGELADALLAIRNHKSKSNKVLFTGKMNNRYSNEMFTLLKALKDYKYYVYLITNGKIFYSYFNLVDWLAIKITLEPWVGFKSHQVIFDGFKDNDPEPSIYNEGNQYPACYLKPDSKHSTKEGIKAFLKKAKVPWNVALPASKAFSDLIYEQKVIPV